MIASAGPAEYAACIDALLTSDEIDALMTIFIPAAPEGAEEMAMTIRDAAFEHHGEKTFLIVYMSSGGAPRLFSSWRTPDPYLPFPEQAAFALSRPSNTTNGGKRTRARLLSWMESTWQPPAPLSKPLIDRGPGWLDPDDVETVLRSYGLAMPKSAVVESVDQALQRPADMAGPVVLKVISESALHKSDVGGVVLNVEGEQAFAKPTVTVTAAVDEPRCPGPAVR